MYVHAYLAYWAGWAGLYDLMEDLDESGTLKSAIDWWYDYDTEYIDGNEYNEQEIKNILKQELKFIIEEFSHWHRGGAYILYNSVNHEFKISLNPAVKHKFS